MIEEIMRGTVLAVSIRAVEEELQEAPSKTMCLIGK